MCCSLKAKIFPTQPRTRLVILVYHHLVSSSSIRQTNKLLHSLAGRTLAFLQATTTTNNNSLEWNKWNKWWRIFPQLSVLLAAEMFGLAASIVSKLERRFFAFFIVVKVFNPTGVSLPDGNCLKFDWGGESKSFWIWDDFLWIFTLKCYFVWWIGYGFKFLTKFIYLNLVLIKFWLKFFCIGLRKNLSITS